MADGCVATCSGMFKNDTIKGWVNKNDKAGKPTETAKKYSKIATIVAMVLSAIVAVAGILALLSSLSVIGGGMGAALANVTVGGSAAAVAVGVIGGVASVIFFHNIGKPAKGKEPVRDLDRPVQPEFAGAAENPENT